jgi:hypothetical protein
MFVSVPDFLVNSLYDFGDINQFKGREMPDPEKKNSKNLEDDAIMRKYVLDVSMYAFSRFVNNRSSMIYGQWNNGLRVLKLRNYARYGFYSIQQYIEQLCPAQLRINEKKNANGQFNFTAEPRRSSETNSTAKNLLNIDLQPYPILPSLMQKAREQILNIKYSPNASCIDPQSQTEKEFEREYKLVEFNPAFQKFKVQLQQMGAQLPNNAEGFNSAEEVNSFFELDGFKLQREEDMIDLMKVSLNESQWDNGIDELLINDLLTISKCAVEVYVDPADNVPRTRYIDASNVFSRVSNYNDSRDTDYVCVLERMSLSSLRRYNEVTKDDIKEIVKKYSNTYSNAYINNNNFEQWYQGYYQQTPTVEFSVNVMRTYFIAQVEDKYTELEREDGSTARNRVGDDYELSKRSEKDGKKIVTSKKELLFQVSWVINTNCVFDYGFCKNVPYKEENGLKRPVMPIRQYNMNVPSFIEKGIVFQDEININTFKLREALIKLPPPPRMVINPKALSDIDIGTGQLQPRDVLDLYQEKGVLYASDIGDYNARLSNSKPVDFMPNGVSEDILLYQKVIDYNFGLCKEVLGISGTLDTAEQPAKRGLGVAQLQLAGANNALKPIVRGYQSVYTGALDALSRAWKLQAKYNARNIKYFGLKSNIFKEINIGSDLYNSEFGIYLKADLIQDQQQHLLEQLTQQKELGVQTNGTSGIDVDQYLAVYMLIMEGELIKAQKLLIMAVRENKKHAMMVAQQNQQSTFQAQQESAQQAMQGKLQMMQAQGQIDQSLQQMKTQGENYQEAQRSETKKMQEQMQNQTETLNTIMKQLGETHRLEMKHNHEKENPK